MFINRRVSDVPGVLINSTVHEKSSLSFALWKMTFCGLFLFVLQLINQKIVMCRQLWGCESFVFVLEYLLTIGNYLNQHAGKEKAKGFRLSSLTKV